MASNTGTEFLATVDVHQKHRLCGNTSFNLPVASPAKFGVVVYCASSNVSTEWIEITRQVVEMIYTMGGVLINGGGGGLMQVATEHMSKLGGSTKLVLLKDLTPSRPYHTLPNVECLWADSMPERKAILSHHAHVCLCLVGGAGTLEELADVYSARKLEWTDKVVSVLNINGFYDGLLQQLKQMVLYGVLPEESRHLIHAPTSVEELKPVLEKGFQVYQVQQTQQIQQAQAQQ